MPGEDGASIWAVRERLLPHSDTINCNLIFSVFQICLILDTMIYGICHGVFPRSSAFEYEPCYLAPNHELLYGMAIFCS